MQSNERFAESLSCVRSNNGIGESRIGNALKEHQIFAEIAAAAMAELNIDWFESAVKVFDKNKRISPQKILKNSKNSKDFYIILVLLMIKFAMQLNLQKINALKC